MAREIVDGEGFLLHESPPTKTLMMGAKKHNMPPIHF